MIAEHLRTRYFQREQPSVTAVHGEIIRDCARQQLARPSLTAVRARIAAWPERAAVVAREGGKAARARYDPVQPGCQPALPFHRVQIDHTRVDVHLVDSVHRLPIGRPWLTLLLDVATRMVLGMHLTLEAPSSAGVALALAHAVAPKQAWLEARDLDVPWPASGLPKTLHLDRGAWPLETGRETAIFRRNAATEMCDGDSSGRPLSVSCQPSPINSRKRQQLRIESTLLSH